MLSPRHLFIVIYQVFRALLHNPNQNPVSLPRMAYCHSLLSNDRIAVGIQLSGQTSLELRNDPISFYDSPICKLLDNWRTSLVFLFHNRGLPLWCTGGSIPCELVKFPSRSCMILGMGNILRNKFARNHCLTPSTALGLACRQLPPDSAPTFAPTGVLRPNSKSN